jgi:hypothetical protein
LTAYLREADFSMAVHNKICRIPGNTDPKESCNWEASEEFLLERKG